MLRVYANESALLIPLKVWKLKPDCCAVRKSGIEALGWRRLCQEIGRRMAALHLSEAATHEQYCHANRRAGPAQEPGGCFRRRTAQCDPRWMRLPCFNLFCAIHMLLLGTGSAGKNVARQSFSASALNASAVSPAARIKLRSVPFATTLWSGTESVAM